MPFYDTDEVLEETEGMSCREIFNTKGEAEFKRAEKAACEKVTERVEVTGARWFDKAHQPHSLQTNRLVIATGGGICNNDEALSVLKKNGLFVFLEVEEEVACCRITKKIAFDETGNITDFSGVPAFIKKHNPKTLDDIKKSFSVFYKERTAIYKKICDIAVRLDDSTKEENLEKVLAATTTAAA